MYKMKKIFYCFLSLLVLLITSCTNQTTVINKVIDQKVDIEENITIKDLEDQLCNVIEIAEQAVVGIEATFDNALLKTESYGSGVVIKKEIETLEKKAENGTITEEEQNENSRSKSAKLRIFEKK